MRTHYKYRPANHIDNQQKCHLTQVWPYTSSSIHLSATRRLLNITHICYEYRTPPPSSLANSDSPDDLTWVWSPHYNQWTGDVIMNIHVVRTPPVRTAVRHTCCQGQTSGLTVRPDGSRWILLRLRHCWRHSPPLINDHVIVTPLSVCGFITHMLSGPDLLSARAWYWLRKIAEHHYTCLV